VWPDPRKAPSSSLWPMWVRTPPPALSSAARHNLAAGFVSGRSCTTRQIRYSPVPKSRRRMRRGITRSAWTPRTR
jgi:hypothetical protein